MLSRSSQILSPLSVEEPGFPERLLRCECVQFRSACLPKGFQVVMRPMGSGLTESDNPGL